MNPNTQIYCDMDGVLVDFLSGACQLMNKWLDDAKDNPPAYRKLAAVYRRVLRDVGPDYQVNTEDDLRIPALRNLMFLLIGRNPKQYFVSNPGQMKSPVHVCTKVVAL